MSWGKKDLSDVRFLKSAASFSTCPRHDLPEITFMGASNVGKSSLLNTLWGRKELAHTSKKPGKTRLLNFFSVGRAYVGVDLPGYGFAAVSGKQKSMWARSVTDYIMQRHNLCRVFLLVDSRHPPKPGDVKAALWLQDVGRPFTLIGTKRDKTPAETWKQHEEAWQVLLTRKTEVQQGAQQQPIAKSTPHLDTTTPPTNLQHGSDTDLSILWVSTSNKKGLQQLRRAVLDSVRTWHQ